MSRVLTWIFVIAAQCLGSGLSAVMAGTGEFQVNSYTTNGQTGPSVAPFGDDNFVVVWMSYGSVDSDTSYGSLQGQRFASDGSTIGDQFQVNSYTTSYQISAEVVGHGGGFVVVWNSYGSGGTDSSGYSIQGQRFATDGSSIGDQFQVNSYTPGDQRRPTVAMNASGSFVIVWNSSGLGIPTFDPNIKGQRFAADGSAVGDEFQINTYTTNGQRVPSVAINQDGGFVVVWESSGSSGSDSSGNSIQGQRFASDGSTIGSEFQVNSYTTFGQAEPKVALTEDGFLVVWESFGSSGSDSSGDSIQGQLFTADGSTTGGEFQINIYTTSFQSAPSLTADPAGGFAVAWASMGSAGTDSSFASVQGRRVTAGGTAIGNEFQINSYTTGFQFVQSLAAIGYGQFAVVWASDGSAGSDSSSSSVQAKLTELTFHDGFESGDISQWSSSSQNIQ